MYLIPLVTSQIWMKDVKYNQVLNQTLVPPGVNSQATLQYTKSLKLAAPLPDLRTLLMINHYKTYHIYYSEMDQSAQ